MRKNRVKNGDVQKRPGPLGHEKMMQKWREGAKNMRNG